MQTEHADTVTGKCELTLWEMIMAILARSSLQNRKFPVVKQQTNKLHGLSPRANYTDRATAACRRNDCQLVRIKGATWSV
jgi:hypothetical protein